jgi:type III restriction enzyme
MKISPILNSPYAEPGRHFQSDKQGLTEQIVDSRRPSTVQIPIQRPRGRAANENHDPAAQAWSSERLKENDFVNSIRAKVTAWRKSGYPGVTKTTQDLLRYWTDSTRDNKLFFCQIEALETLVYITEVAEKVGEHWIINDLKKFNQDANAGLYRLAFKLATGTGKTVVMAMIITYNTLNKIRYPQDTRFTDTFVLVTPGITIRDRLNVLHPNNPKNYYMERDIVPVSDFDDLNRANILIVNFQQMVLRLLI